MQLKKLGLKRAGKALSLYREAFPANERKPILNLIRNAACGRYELFTAEDETGFCGICNTVLHKDTVLIDYLAVAPQKRSCGFGTEILKEVFKRYEGRRIYLEIEDPDLPGEDKEMRQRRLAFYERSGFCRQTTKALVFSVHFELLSYGGNVSFCEYKATLKSVLGPLFWLLKIKEIHK